MFREDRRFVLFRAKLWQRNFTPSPPEVGFLVCRVAFATSTKHDHKC